MTTPIAYKLADAAAATGLSGKTLLRAITAGTLPAKRTGKPDPDGKPTGVYLIKADDLMAFIDGLEAA